MMDSVPHMQRKMWAHTHYEKWLATEDRDGRQGTAATATIRNLEDSLT